MRAFVVFAFLGLVGVAHCQSEPKLKPDLSNVSNLTAAKKFLKLGKPHLAALQKNLFVVTPGGDEQLYDEYGSNDYANFPSVITTDNVLQIFHVFFDSTLRHVEQHHLIPEIKKVCATMIKQGTLRYAKLRSTRLSSAALKNLAYFGVADRLLGGKASLPNEANLMVSREVASIRKGIGPSPSAIFPYSIDYSQFIVRGHYTRSAALGRYFQALMWFGLAPIAIETDGPKLEQARQAALMVQDLCDGPGLASWQRIYDVTSLFVGDANDLTPSQWRTLAAPVLGWPQNLDRLADDAVVTKLVASMVTRFQPKIVNKAHNGTATGVQFKLMGQRSIPDSIVFNRLTGDERLWPSPLDVAAAFGSGRAAQILDSNAKAYNPSGWSQYVPERTKIASEIAGWKESDWTKNLYNGSLDLIRLNLLKPSSKAPQFMQSSAWADKSISSSLAFWAGLRHDTILYGSQTASESGDGDEQPFVRGYVEPNVALYERMIALLDQMQGGLKRFGFLNPDETSRFHDFKALLSFFASASKRELNGGKLTKEEHWKIRKIEGDLLGLTLSLLMDGEGYAALTEDDWDMGLVADVHNSGGQALTVGSGHSDDLVAVVPIEGKLYLARGSVFSFYEFKVPVANRMTDHEWKQRLRAGHAPPRPSWIGSYFVNISSRGKEQ